MRTQRSILNQLCSIQNRALNCGPEILKQTARKLVNPVTTQNVCEFCLNVTCVQRENGKSISTIDSTQATKAHDADTDSELARPPDGKHPSARHATPTMLLRSATRRRTDGHVVAHLGSG